MRTIKATAVTMELRLVVERPEGSKPLNVLALEDWVQDQISDLFITLPFDNDTRALLESEIMGFDDGIDIDYELDPICHTYIK